MDYSLVCQKIFVLFPFINLVNIVGIFDRKGVSLSTCLNPPQRVIVSYITQLPVEILQSESV